MVLVYCDTSMLLRLVVEEPGSRLATELWDGADAVASARLADLEMRASLSGAVRADLLSAAAGERAAAVWHELREGLRWLELTAPVADLAADLVERHPIRASDAIHLAAALTLASPDTVMAVFERRLWAAAQAEGLSAVPQFE